MSLTPQAKYIPPHKRNGSLSKYPALDSSYPLASLNDPVEPPDHFSAIEKHIFKHSAVFRGLIAIKERFSSNPQVEVKFQVYRKQSVAAGPRDPLSTTFRDQFEAALGEINEQVDGALETSWGNDEKEGLKAFIDLGCAPGGFSKWILEHNPEARGFGVTLSAEEHGLNFSTESWDSSTQSRYQVLKVDLTACMETIIGYFGEGQCDLIIAGAVYRDEYTAKVDQQSKKAQPVSSFHPRQVLSLSQLTIALKSLCPGGILVMVASLKPLPVTIAILQLLRVLFGRLTATKGKHLHHIRSSYYLVCQQFRADQATPELLARLDATIQHLVVNDSMETDWGVALLGDGFELGDALSDGNLKFVCDHLEPMWVTQTSALERGLKQARGFS